MLGEAPVRFVRFLERRLGGTFLFDVRKVPYGKTELIDVFEIAAKLQEAGVIGMVSPALSPADEPPFKQWTVEYKAHDMQRAGGMATSSDRDALIPALAEAVERNLWLTATDHFDLRQTATVSEILTQGDVLLPSSFVGFSEKQRSENSRLTLREDATYLWTRGRSHVTNDHIWIPAQVVSGALRSANSSHHHEPMILTPITTGLATGPTKEFALLNGALEILERDAFMITWLNQLTPPRLDIATIAERDEELASLIRMCTRYRLKPAAVLMPTDAPTHVVCAVIEDLSDHRPNVTIGMKAHRSIVAAVKGALHEALRIRQTVRFRDRSTPLDPSKPGAEVLHLERAQYWGAPGSARKLDFLIAGEPTVPTEAAWEHDTLEEHWKRIVSWCKKEGYAIASADLGRSKKNASPWEVHMVVMPQMQPMHQTERLIYLGGERLTSVPKKFGHTPRPEPFADEPHPFA